MKILKSLIWGLTVLLLADFLLTRSYISAVFLLMFASINLGILIGEKG